MKYKIVKISNVDKADEIINELAIIGWMLESIVPHSNNGGLMLFAVMSMVPLAEHPEKRDIGNYEYQWEGLR